MMEHKLVHRVYTLPNGDQEIALEEVWEDGRRIAVAGETIHREKKNFVFTPDDAAIGICTVSEGYSKPFTMKIDYSTH